MEVEVVRQRKQDAGCEDVGEQLVVAERARDVGREVYVGYGEDAWADGGVPEPAEEV